MTPGQFRFLAPGRVIFGSGSNGQLGEVLGASGGKDGVLLLTDQGLRQTGLPDRLSQDLKEKGFSVEVYDGIPPEPYDHDVDRAAAAVSGRKISTLIALGGGSVMDTAKLLSNQLATGKTTRDLLHSPPEGRGIPLVMIPTTAGTGSEATPNAIIALREEQTKSAVISPWFLPDTILLDPENTQSLPAGLTAAGGVDALCHLMECFVSRKRNPHSDMMALQGMTLAFSSIRKAYHDGQDDRDAREKMLLASYYGGACIASSGTMAIHGMSYPLGGRFRVPHGVANAILLEPVFRYISSSIEDLLPQIALCAGLPAEDYRQVPDYLKSLVDELNIPRSMKDFGVEKSDLKYMTEKAYENKRLMGNTPVDLSPEDILAIYKDVF